VPSPALMTSFVMPIVLLRKPKQKKRMQGELSGSAIEIYRVKETGCLGQSLVVREFSNAGGLRNEPPADATAAKESLHKCGTSCIIIRV